MTRPGTTLLQGTVANVDGFRPKIVMHFTLCNNCQIMNICPFNLHPKKWFEGYPVKSTQIFFSRCSPAFFSNLEVWHPSCHPEKKSGYILQSIFYRVPFTSIFRVQIKKTNCVTKYKVLFSMLRNDLNGILNYISQN